MSNLFRIENKLDKLCEVFENYSDIICVLIFGSYNTTYYNEKSDIDFGIIYDNEKDITLFDELKIEDSISEVLTTDNIDVINLNKAPLVFTHKALQTGNIIYERDYIKISDFLERIYNQFCDYEYRYRVLCKEYEDSLREEYIDG